MEWSGRTENTAEINGIFPFGEGKCENCSKKECFEKKNQQGKCIKKSKVPKKELKVFLAKIIPVESHVLFLLYSN